MSYLWKKHNLGLKTQDCKDGVTKMNNFRKTFQDQIGKHSQINEGGVNDISKTKKKQKRYRSAFTTMQITLLEKEFKKDPYVTNVRREQVANSLNIPERAVKIWFQNRRMKEKRDTGRGPYDMEVHLDTEPVKISITNDMINKLSGTCNQQTASTRTSLAAKIVFSDDEIVKTRQSNTTDDKKSSRLDTRSLKWEVGNVAMAACTATNTSDPPITEDSPKEDEKDQKPSPVSSTSKQETYEAADKLPASHARNSGLFHNERGRQPVGFILPFSQIPATEPQKMPENLTVTREAEQQTVLKTENVEITIDNFPQYPPAPAVEIPNFYPSLPIQQVPWNRYNFIPVMPPGSQSMPLYPNDQTLPNVVPNTHLNGQPIKKCCCDCHSGTVFDAGVRYQQPQTMLYAQYVPHFIASVPSHNPNTKF